MVTIKRIPTASITPEGWHMIAAEIMRPYEERRRSSQAKPADIIMDLIREFHEKKNEKLKGKYFLTIPELKTYIFNHCQQLLQPSDALVHIRDAGAHAARTPDIE